MGTEKTPEHDLAIDKNSQVYELLIKEKQKKKHTFTIKHLEFDKII